MISSLQPFTRPFSLNYTQHYCKGPAEHWCPQGRRWKNYSCHVHPAAITTTDSGQRPTAEVGSVSQCSGSIFLTNFYFFLYRISFFTIFSNNGGIFREKGIQKFRITILYFLKWLHQCCQIIYLIFISKYSRKFGKCRKKNLWYWYSQIAVIIIFK